MNALPSAATRRQAFVSAGANLGDRAGTLRAATDRLRAVPGVLRVEASSLYETAPVGGVEQPDFLNLVIGVETTLTPEDVLSSLLGIEREFGRVRAVRWGPRTLDLDLLVYEGESRATTLLTLPHPRMYERAFVLVPLWELLNQVPFQDGRWGELRSRISSIQIDAPGVRPWTGQ